MRKLVLVFWMLLLTSCLFAQRRGSYVKSYMTRSGKFVSGHYRKSFSTSKNAYKNRIASKQYYRNKGKYRRRKSY